VLVPLVIGVLAGAGTVLYALYDLRRAMFAWTAAYGFGVTAAVAALALAFTLHLAGAKWWLAVRTPLLACAATMPLFVLGFVPIALTLRHLYPWQTIPEDAPEHIRRALEHQRAWNEPGFFVARAALYLAVWTFLALALRRTDARWATSVSDAESERLLARARRLAGPAMPVLGLTLTFAAFDWFMSLEPGWSSDMYGLYVGMGGLVGATSIAAIGAWAARRAGLLRDEVHADHFHALGRLMLMATILWAYIAFFQLLLVWIADEPREVTFYAARSAGSWGVIDVVLVVGHFLVPFLALLIRRLKQSAGALAIVAAWALLMDALDFEWFVVPSSAGRIAAADILPFVCVFALAWAWGAHLVTRAPAARRELAAFREALRYRSP
jgi:hypothetical protein